MARAMLSLLEKDHAEDLLVLIDPLDCELGAVFKPHFACLTSRAPRDLSPLANVTPEADACAMVSPEYNRSLSPTLAHPLDYFGSSLYAYKSGLTVTYSAGQWGGVRAAVGMRGDSEPVLQTFPVPQKPAPGTG